MSNYQKELMEIRKLRDSLIICKCLNCKTPMNILGENEINRFWVCPECNHNRMIRLDDKRFKRLKR